MNTDPKKFDWNSVGLDFGNWEEEKIWALDLPISEMSASELEWHLDCPFWENDHGERYSITPRQVIEKFEGTNREQEKVEQSNTSYPLEVYYNRDKWLILDGLHRLAKLYASGAKKVKVRIITEDTLPLILTGEPIEMPTWWNNPQQ